MDAHQIRRPAKNPGVLQGGVEPSVSEAVSDREARAGAQLSVYDPRHKQFTLVDTCFGTHHLQFAEDANDTLWYCSGGGEVVGWVNTKLFDETEDAAKSQGWTAFILDTNGNGKRDAYVEPEPAGRSDARTSGSAAASTASSRARSMGRSGSRRCVASPADRAGRARAESAGDDAGGNLRAAVRPPRRQGYRPRGIDIDRNGVVWTALAGSGHLASFDRRKCKVAQWARRRGRHCPEGWTMYPMPGPKFKGVTDAAAAPTAAITTGSTSSICRPGQEHADRHRHRLRVAAGA